MTVPRQFEIPCTIEIEQTHDCFHAHLALEGDIAIGPGDRVHVHGEPIRVAFGQKLTERRRATVTRAGLLRRAWTRLVARFELQELFEVSFTTRRSL
jgi:hypothetical protein